MNYYAQLHHGPYTKHPFPFALFVKPISPLGQPCCGLVRQVRLTNANLLLARITGMAKIEAHWFIVY